jgi:predicted Zn-dependent protease
MLDTEAFGEFRKALGMMRDGDAEEALPHIKRAAELEQHNPFYMSYLGVALARAERRWVDAENLCDTAMRMKRDQPQLYLNLAEVYLAAGQKQDAIETLVQGLKYAQRDSRMNSMLGKLSSRRKPLIPFLGREHFINRHLGTLRHKAAEALHSAPALHAEAGLQRGGHTVRT